MDSRLHGNDGKVKRDGQFCVMPRTLSDGLRSNARPWESKNVSFCPPSYLSDLSLQQEFEYFMKIQKNQGTPPHFQYPAEEASHPSAEGF